MKNGKIVKYIILVSVVVIVILITALTKNDVDMYGDYSEYMQEVPKETELINKSEQLYNSVEDYTEVHVLYEDAEFVEEYNTVDITKLKEVGDAYHISVLCGVTELAMSQYNEIVNSSTLYKVESLNDIKAGVVSVTLKSNEGTKYLLIGDMHNGTYKISELR